MIFFFFTLFCFSDFFWYKVLGYISKYQKMLKCADPQINCQGFESNKGCAVLLVLHSSLRTSWHSQKQTTLRG